MKIYLSTIVLILLLFASQVLVNAKETTYVSNANYETGLVSMGNDATKASLSNDLKLTYEQTSDQLDAPIGYLANNWGNILIALIGISEVITRLVPSVKDNSIFNFFIKILNAVVPNLKKSGGTF